jgi:flavin reductase (DIM6/NTAB) family NADH-FMN oxidoreductase RutF
MDVEPISGQLFRDALSRFASGVTIVAARTANGLVGFTATGFTSVSLEPPLILVCVGRRASAHDGIVDADRFGVSVLATDQAWIAEQCARSCVDRFRGVALSRDRVPQIDGAIAQLACLRHARHEAGDHTILVGEVLSGVIGSGRPLVHFARRFGGFTTELVGRPIPDIVPIQRGESP